MPVIELGNAAPTNSQGPAVTSIHIPNADENGVGGYSMPDDHSDELYPEDLAKALAGVSNKDARRFVMDGWLTQPGRMKGLPNHEAFVVVIDPDGIWASHSKENPTWVWSDNKVLEQMLSDYYGCPIGPPDDLEDTHHTRSGPPGVGPDPLGGMTMLKTQSGNDIQAQQMGGGLIGETGTATATTATSLTSNSAISHAVNDLAGQTVVALTTGVYGLITGNTSGVNTVLTVDRWYVPLTPGGTAAATPAATTGYTIMPGALAAWYMALTATATAPASTDVTLSGEIVTAGGGLIRKICPYAHTAGAASYTLTPVFTANGSDTFPVTVAKIGVSQSITSGVRNLFQTLLNATATFSLAGDQVTITETVSL